MDLKLVAKYFVLKYLKIFFFWLLSVISRNDCQSLGHPPPREVFYIPKEVLNSLSSVSFRIYCALPCPALPFPMQEHGKEDARSHPYCSIKWGHTTTVVTPNSHFKSVGIRCLNTFLGCGAQISLCFFPTSQGN